MLKLLLVCSLLVIFHQSGAVDEIKCEEKELKFEYDAVFPSPDGSEFNIDYHCEIGTSAIISSAGGKFSNAKNENITELRGIEIPGMRFFPDDIADTFPSLKSITFAGNPVKTVSYPTFRGLHKLNRLFLHGNLISSIDEDSFDDLEAVQELQLTNNKLTSLPAKVFSKLTSLDHLSLNENQLTTLEPGIFQNTIKLRLLFLQENKLESFEPGTFDSLVNLRQIWLHDNKLSVLDSDWFKNIANVNEIRLENNGISEIPLNFLATLKSLEEIYFSGNPLSTIDFAMFEHNHKVMEISFEGVKVVKALNLDALNKLTNLASLEFVKNNGSCIIGYFYKENLKDLKSEVEKNCEK